MSSHRLYLHLCSILFILAPLYPQSVQFDTVSIEFFGNSVKHIHYRTTLPQEIFVAEIDLKDPSLRLESVRHHGLIPTSTIVKERSSGNKEVIAALNADFFSFTDSSQVNNQVEEFIPVTGYTTPQKSAFAVLENGSLIMDGFSFGGTIITAKDHQFKFNRLNRNRTLSEITLYTDFRGISTRTDSGGVEIVLEPLGPRMTANNTSRFIVTRALSGVNSVIPRNGAVISFGRSDTASKFLSKFNSGDTVSITTHYAPAHDNIRSNIRMLISGWGRILRNGMNLPALADTNEGLTAKFTAVRHPRSFIGFNADTSKLYLCAADGRQEQSVGMTFLEMSNFLLSIGVTDAMNFDGGGSTTLVINGTIVNSPSDRTGERPVANSILLTRQKD
ncbi:MAG: phosphodiester glycosidase family protein [Bacteroidota bacterium]